MGEALGMHRCPSSELLSDYLTTDNPSTAKLLSKALVTNKHTGGPEMTANHGLSYLYLTGQLFVRNFYNVSVAS